uniref:Uncharacterized protein n=1 Tax=Cacopsylla melanoneura TaxID=428564 RepID=A0A8D8XZQ0_9HEMI
MRKQRMRIVKRKRTVRVILTLVKMMMKRTLLVVMKKRRRRKNKKNKCRFNSFIFILNETGIYFYFELYLFRKNDKIIVCLIIQKVISLYFLSPLRYVCI